MRVGVYRLVKAPFAVHDDLLRAWVWSNYRGAISHESALALYDLSDVLPIRVQLTAPLDFGRYWPVIDLHRATLPDADVRFYAGVQVTTPDRSIVDAAVDGSDPEQVCLAVTQAIRRALVSPDRLRALARRPHYRHAQRGRALIEGAILRAGT